MSTSQDFNMPQSNDGRMLRLLASGWIFLLLLVLICIFTGLRPSQFASAYNMQQLAINAALILVLAAGQTYVIIAAGIDLSIGSVLVFCSVVSAQVMLALSGDSGTTFGTTSAGWGVILIGVFASIVTGILWGLLNGFLVSVAKIPALIVTLGTMGMALGGAQILSGGVDVRAMPELLVTEIGSGRLFGIPVLVLIAVVCVIVAGLVLRFTRFGLHVYAVGSNDEGARRSGIKVTQRMMTVYAISGAMAGIAAVMANARFATTTINGHAMDNLTTISAVVLGGTSLFGGSGGIFGTVIGVFIPIILLNGFVILGIPPFWQTVAMGAVLILAVWIDQLKRRLRKRG
ncbi:ribose transport system permease protein [Cohaesibacter marisflavi]|uniref:Ribose transport system permease protein n=1 Tax=Cohaesibacter marisflavi TaxID=655353 RepID=A0A1I5J8B3_9HYPH|nr:ABC transporter permease [Cohaesibacter marisflavi]SFO68919.1 ribose transport system permease protein [Cohaesibacter marisflavi]